MSDKVFSGPHSINCISFEIGQIVYLKTDEDQKARIITAVLMRQNYVSYECNSGNQTSWHTEVEIAVEKNMLAKMGIEK